ncbi:MAG: hypothetical protein LBT33_10695 [Spirochaetia bacterium]|jgi:hypothetical protein|nr:hypothetical protein [Spirochaetia bacterium]
MKFLVDNEGFAVNTAQMTAVRIKTNKNDGSFKNNRDYPFVADVHVSGREKPFTVFLTQGQGAELSLFVKEREMEGGGA